MQIWRMLDAEAKIIHEDSPEGNLARFAHPSMGQVRTLKWLPYCAAITALVTAIPFAWDKSFDNFLFLIFCYLPVVALACIGLCVWAAIERNSPRSRPIVISVVIILALISSTFWALPRIKDELRFSVWSYTHGDIIRGFADRDAIILNWEGWGMAGMENDAYLVSNPSDNLAEPGAASEWLRHVGSSCEIVASKRLRRGIYVVTTYNCPLR
jgi:hypothetical protein